MIKWMLIAVLAFGCVTQRQRERILKECVLSNTKKDSVALIITERLVPYIVHDSIPYLLPNPCADLCDSLGRLKTDFKAIITSDKGTKVSLSVKNNKLSISDNLTGLKGTIAIKDTIIKEFHEETKEVRANCMLEHLTKWDSFWIRIGQILSCVLLGFFGVKTIKSFLF